jgi:hypothetical protein
MRPFVEHIITALKEDDWEIKTRAIRHVKSFLVIDTDDMQPYEVPFKFTWWERRVVGYHVRKLNERMLLATLIAGRINPRKAGVYSHSDSFLK